MTDKKNDQKYVHVLDWCLFFSLTVSMCHSVVGPQCW